MIHYINDNYTINKLDPNKNDNIITLNLKEGKDNAIYNTDLLQKMIEAYPKGTKTFFIKTGEYYFNPIDFTSLTGTVQVRLVGESMENGAAAYFNRKPVRIHTSKQDFMYDAREDSDGMTVYVDNIYFESYQGYAEVPSGICFGCNNPGRGEFNFHFNNVGFHGYDYAVLSKGYSCGASGGKDISFSTCHYGIYINKANHLFHIENLELTYNRVGVRLCHGGVDNTIRGVHVATGYLGADKDDFDEFLVIHTKGRTVVDSLYWEDYENSAQPEKTIIFDFEGWAYGCGPLIIKNTSIGKPGARGGKWLRARGYLGGGPETGAENTTRISSRSGLMTYYPEGLVVLEGCNAEYYKTRDCLDAMLSYMDLGQTNVINGITTGFQLTNRNGTTFYGKSNYECSYSAVSKMNNFLWYYGEVIPAEEDSDYGYKYKIINNLAWGDKYRDTGLSMTEMFQREMYSRQYGLTITGTLTVTSNTLTDDNEYTLGVFLKQHSLSEIKGRIFKPIYKITKNTPVGTMIPINVFIPPNDFAESPSFAYRTGSDIDTTAMGTGSVKYDIDLNFINE